MEYVWIYLSLAAGTLQTIRNATSKTLTKQLRPNAITLVRFGYGLPFTAVYLIVLLFLGFQPGLITIPVIFFASLVALFQIVGNFLLVSLFNYKNFAVAVNFSRTDNISAAIIGVFFFSQFIHFWGIIAICIACIGVFYANAQKTHFAMKPLIIGFSSGFAIAVALFFVRFANDNYIGGDLIFNAGLTLFITLIIQTGVLLFYHYFWEREQLMILMQHKRSDLIIGTSSAMGSLCWFLASSLAHIAFVRTVGQIEVVWTIIASHILFKERLRYNEWIGILLTVVGIIVLVMNQ